MEKEKIRIIIADDHAIVRRGIRLLLEDETHLDIIDEASDGQMSLEKCQELNPNILISDVSMPEISGIELPAILREECPTVKVLLLTMHQEPEYVIKAFKNGVYGYLHKGVEEDEIVTAINEISKGDKYYNNNVAKILAENLVAGDKKEDDEVEELTKREKEILSELVNGLSNKKIAEKLFISVRTVDTHRANIMTKLNVNKTAALVKYALENKLVD
jgi:two-component system nitrate/nitrite response regulator NarL